MCVKFKIFKKIEATRKAHFKINSFSSLKTKNYKKCPKVYKMCFVDKLE